MDILFKKIVYRTDCKQPFRATIKRKGRKPKPAKPIRKEAAKLYGAMILPETLKSTRFGSGVMLPRNSEGLNPILKTVRKVPMKAANITEVRKLVPDTLNAQIRFILETAFKLQGIKIDKGSHILPLYISLVPSTPFKTGYEIINLTPVYIGLIEISKVTEGIPMYHKVTFNRLKSKLKAYLSMQGKYLSESDFSVIAPK